MPSAQVIELKPKATILYLNQIINSSFTTITYYNNS